MAVDLGGGRRLDGLGVAGEVGREVLDALAVVERRLGGGVVDRGGRRRVGRRAADLIVGLVDPHAAGVARAQRHRRQARCARRRRRRRRSSGAPVEPRIGVTGTHGQELVGSVHGRSGSLRANIPVAGPISCHGARQGRRARRAGVEVQPGDQISHVAHRVVYITKQLASLRHSSNMTPLFRQTLGAYPRSDPCPRAAS